MPNLPDLTKLPSNLREPGDPVEGNPFPKGTLEHKVWESSTRQAEEEMSRLLASLSAKRPTEPVAYCTWLIELCIKKYDIWAKRAIHVVWSDPAVRAYDQWLFNYAESWLRLVNEKTFVPIPMEFFLNELRLGLIARMQWWKAEARRYLTEQEKHREALKAKKVEIAKSDFRTDRRKAVDAYIEEVRQKTGKKITRTDIWKAARYRTRTEFERWERCDPRATNTANERFTRILSEKPHLK
jgi:hypothetical protein